MKYILITLSFLVSASLYAEISTIYFKDITKHFKDARYNPIMGRWALDSGYIHNLRFYGPFKPAYESSGKRLYVNDVPQDAMMKLLITLFPSPLGSLASSTGAVSNFGKNVTVETVAHMLRFTKRLRQIFERHLEKPIDPKTVKKYATGKIAFFRNEVNQLKGQFRSIGGQFDLILESMLKEYPGDLTFSDIPFEFSDDMKNNLKAFLSNNPGGIVLFDVIAFLQEKYSLIKKRVPQSYPKFTVENIILGFFVHKFSNKNDLVDLMKNLGVEFISGEVDRNGLLQDPRWNKDNISSNQYLSDLDSQYFKNFYRNLGGQYPISKILLLSKRAIL